LERGSWFQVLAAAGDLPRIELDDALRIVLRLHGTERAERASVRWLARFALEAPTVGLEDVRLAADALDELPEPDARERLARLCRAHGLERVARVAEAAG
jgi:hypothetical protein